MPTERSEARRIAANAAKPPELVQARKSGLLGYRA
jgi:hypothetical protein